MYRPNPFKALVSWLQTGFHWWTINRKLLPGPRFDLEEWVYEPALFLLSTPNPQTGLLGMWQQVSVLSSAEVLDPRCFAAFCEDSKQPSCWYAASELMILR